MLKLSLWRKSICHSVRNILKTNSSSWFGNVTYLGNGEFKTETWLFGYNVQSFQTTKIESDDSIERCVLPSFLLKPSYKRLNGKGNQIQKILLFSKLSENLIIE